MFCPELNSECKYERCPYYLEPDLCLKALDVKRQLGLLTQGEKQLLTKQRVKIMKGGTDLEAG